MRQIVTVLAWIGFGTIPLSLANPPAPNTTADTASSSSSPTQPSNSPETKEPSSTASPAAAPPATSASDTDPREKLLLRMGFRPRMQNGQKVFCKREQALGSRVEGTTLCGTLDHWVNQFQLSREAVDQTQRYGTNPSQKLGPSGH